MRASGGSLPGQADVIVCGGGPTGLAAAFLLGRAGLSVALFERRAETTKLPKGQYLHAATGELFRQWGLWDALADRGWETEKSNGQGFYVNIASGAVAEVRAASGAHADYAKKWQAVSPVYPRKVPASDYEAALYQGAARWPNAGLHFNTRVVDVECTPHHVCVTVEQTDTGQRQRLCAPWLIACDGAHSFIRSRLGQGQDHGPTFGNQVLVEFHANLDGTLGKDGFFHSFVLHPRYAGWFGSQHPDTGLWRYSFRHDEENPPPQAVILARLRGALGMPDIPVRIVRTWRFDYSTGLLRRWRQGRVLFAGDAAHWHSPWGGFGMNSGIQDANNLAWKLALVCKGAAPDGLLDTYETERKSKALLTVKSATYNALHYQAIAESVRVGEAALLAQGKLSPQAQLLLRQCVQPHGDNSVLHTGYQLGTVYTHGALVLNGEQAPAPELQHYRETTVPGVRAPHAWLRDAAGKRVSTIDLWGPGFTLIGYRIPACWDDAARHVAHALGVDICCVCVGEGGEGGNEGNYQAADAKFAEVYGAVPATVLVVRPDGFIGAKLLAEAGGSTARAALLDAMRAILGIEADAVDAADTAG